jgi:hypothetical protein
VAIPVCSWSSRHSSSVCLAGSKGALLHRANPTDLRHPCGTTDALIVPKHSGIKPLSDSTADASLRWRYGSCTQPSICETDALLLSYSSLRDVRVRWCRDLLDHAMPHASCASRAGSHGTPRLQAQRPAKSFDISLTLSRHLGFYLPALACKARTGGLPLSLRCRCLA